MLRGLRDELERAEHVPVVGDGEGLHPVGLGFFEHPFDARRAVEEAELGMAVEVAEIWHFLKEIIGEGKTGRPVARLR